jgi:HEAT repeat protein
MEQVFECLKALKEEELPQEEADLLAKEIAKREDWQIVLCRSVFDPHIVEMEVLARILAELPSPSSAYAALEQLPESLTFANLRLRARGLAYVKGLDQQRLEALAERLLDFVARRNSSDEPYGDRIVESFSNAKPETRAYLVERLASQLDKAWVGLWAVSAIGEIGGEHALTKLLEILEKGDGGLRMQSAFALGKFKNETAAVDALRQALKNNESAAVRWAAASSLGEIGNPRAAEELLGALKAEESMVRSSAAEALRKINDPKVTAALEKDLENEDVKVRSVAAFALGNSQALIGILKARENNLEERARAASALGAIKAEEAVDTLLAAILEQMDPKALEGHVALRRSATFALGEIGKDRAIGRGAIEALLKALAAEDNDIRWPAAWELGKIGNDLAVAGLVAALKDRKHSGTRWRAAEALGKIGGIAAKDALLKTLDDDDHFVSRSAALALARLGVDEQRVVKHCFDAITDAETLVRWRAAEVLGRVGGARAVPQLIEALRDDIEVRDPAARSLESLSSTDLAQGLLLALEDNNDFVRRKAAQVIGYCQSDEAVLAKLRDLATNDPADSVRHAAIDAQREIALKLALCPGSEGTAQSGCD